MSKNGYPPNRLCLVLLAILFACAQLVSISCASPKKQSKKSSKATKEAKTTATEVNFSVHNSKAIVPDDLAQSRAEEVDAIKNREVDEIATQIKRYYEVAFLQPSLWENSTFSDLDSLFVAPLRDRVAKEDLNQLSLGDEAKKIHSVDTVDARISDIWIALDKDLAPQLCQVKAEVEAVYVQRDKRKADLESSATFLLQPTTDTEWQIFNYDVRHEVKTEEN